MENTDNIVDNQKNEYTEEDAPSSPLPPKDTTVDLVDNESDQKTEDAESKPEDEAVEETNENTENEQTNDTNEVEKSETSADDEAVHVNEVPYNSITQSMIEITKSQLLDSMPTSMNVVQESEECHNNEEFITSKHSEMIESTYEQKESEAEDKTQETEQKNMENSCVDLGNSDDFQSQVIELNKSLITSMELNSNETPAQPESVQKETEKIETNKTENVETSKSTVLTDSCVDLAAEKAEKDEPTSKEEVKEQVEEYAPNNSMEIIDQKQCEEEYEKVDIAETTASTKEEPKRKLEDEVFEKPLGGDSLQKKITQYGEQFMGRDWRPVNGQICTISYEAKLKDTSTVVEKNDDLSFVLGDGDVISALDLIVSLMAKNEKCEMITEERHAFGALGKKPDIPSNATLHYNIHLKEFKDMTDFGLMEPVERLSLAEAKKLRGNFHFNRQDFTLAGLSYKRGLKYFSLENLKGDEETEDVKKFAELKKALLMNLALADFKLTEYKKALNSLNEVLEIESSHMKALYIRGKVLVNLGETQEAILSLSKAHELAKDNIEVKNELAKAQAKHKTQYEKEKRMYQKMMRGTSEEKKKEKEKKKETSSFLSYTIAGLLMGGAAIGAAMLAKSKNLL